jgi:hypothetical protein
VKYCLLSAQQSHCTVASNVFHCHLFSKDARPYTRRKRQSYYDYMTELNVIGFSG